jgi:hypothetical protein
LPIPVRLRAAEILAHLLPGGSGRALAERVEPRPQELQRLVDHGASRIQQAQGIRLGLIWQAYIVRQGLASTACAHRNNSFCL